MATTVAFSDLDTWLQNQPINTEDTPYELEITGLTASDIGDSATVGKLGYVLISNSMKYVDLRDTVLPNGNNSLRQIFSYCPSLVFAPQMPNDVEDIEEAFMGCTSLKESPTIPNSVTNMNNAFEMCTSLTTVYAQTFNPNNIPDYFFVFAECDNLTEFYSDTPCELKSWLNTIHTESRHNFPNDPDNCTFRLYSDPAEIPHSDLSNQLSALTANTTSTPFKIKVTGLTVNDLEDSATSGTLGYILNQNSTKYVDLSETIMPNATDLTSTFENCTTLVESPDLPSTVIVLDSTYKGCSNITKITEVPSGVTDLTECFKNCSSLEEIEEFDVPLSVLKTNAQNCFSGCTSLTSIGINKVDLTEASEWHAMRLNFGADNVSGKVYDKDKNTTTIPQTTIVKGTLTLPVKTDELWFPPSNMSDSDIDDVIEDVIDAKRTYFNKNVLNPSSKSFVLWKDSQSQFVSNIDFGGGGGSGIEVYPTEEDIIEDLPNLNDGDIVASYGDGEGFNDAPLGAIADYYGATDPSGGRWLICDGRDTTGTTIELETHYPSLYLFLGGTNVLPDYSGGTNAKIIKATTTAEVNPLPTESVAEIESFTTSYLATKLSNLLQVDHIWSTPITVASTTLTRTLNGYHFNDYDFIISEVSFYSDAQHNFMPIPKSSVQTSYGAGADFFLQGASTSGTDRRIGFTIDSDTTFRVTMLNGTSGNMPKFQGFYGIKFNLT